MHALPRITHEHHDLLLPHVEELAAIGREVGQLPPEQLGSRLENEAAFIAGHLIPHMDRAESTLYPELERLLQNRHSMTPMRRDHATLRHLIGELEALRHRSPTPEVRARLRRVLFRMYAIVQVHLAEEEAYVRVLDGNLSPAELEGLARGMDHEVGQT